MPVFKPRQEIMSGLSTVMILYCLPCLKTCTPIAKKDDLDIVMCGYHKHSDTEDAYFPPPVADRSPLVELGY